MDVARAQSSGIANLNDAIAIDRGAAAIGVGSVEDHRAAVANQVGPRRAGNRADDDGVAGTGKHLAVNVQQTAARAEVIGIARTQPQAASGIVATR